MEFLATLTVFKSEKKIQSIEKKDIILSYNYRAVIFIQCTFQIAVLTMHCKPMCDLSNGRKI